MKPKRGNVNGRFYRVKRNAKCSHSWAVYDSTMMGPSDQGHYCVASGLTWFTATRIARASNLAKRFVVHPETAQA